MTTLFDKLFSATSDTIKAAKKPFVEGKLKRRFDSAISDAEEQKLDMEMRLQYMQECISESYDLNNYIFIKSQINAADETIKLLTEHKEELFTKTK